MRKVVAAAGLVALLAVAAAPPADRLNAVLKRWDAARRSARQSHYKFTLWTTTEPVTHKKTAWHGEVSVQRPDRVRIDVKDEKGGPMLLALFTGGQARAYFLTSRKVLLLSFPGHVRIPAAVERCVGDCRERCIGTGGLLPGVGSICDGPPDSWVEGYLFLVLGPPSRGLAGRFVPRLEKEDGRWSYVRLKPRWREADVPWRLVLHKEAGWLRRVSRPGGLAVEFEEPDRGPLPASTWEPPFKELPKGWTSEALTMFGPGREP
jgi:hypothetical protein